MIFLSSLWLLFLGRASKKSQKLMAWERKLCSFTFLNEVICEFLPCPEDSSILRVLLFWAICFLSHVNVKGSCYFYLHIYPTKDMENQIIPGKAYAKAKLWIKERVSFLLYPHFHKFHISSLNINFKMKQSLKSKLTMCYWWRFPNTQFKSFNSDIFLYCIS